MGAQLAAAPRPRVIVAFAPHSLGTTLGTSHNAAKMQNPNNRWDPLKDLHELQIRVPPFNSGRGPPNLKVPVAVTTGFSQKNSCETCGVKKNLEDPRPGQARSAMASASRLFCTAFRGSSVVERPTVNRMVVGSNPTRGANDFNLLPADGVPQKLPRGTSAERATTSSPGR